MKHLFIINPAAGKYDHTVEFTSAIRTVCEPKGLAYEVLVSRAPGDCTTIAQAAAASGEELRIYACGGDGTLNEVVNGVAGCENVAVTHYPGGSGNDFIKIFDQPDAFRDLSRLIDGDEASFDLIRCQDNYWSLNICSMGFDARVGTQINNYKKIPLVTGSGAYAISAMVNIVRGIHRHYVVELDEKTVDARQSMICIANGRWYGGGFNATPDAEPDDGLLDVLLVKAISRAAVLKIIGKYKGGHYKDYPDVFHLYRCRRVAVHCDEPSEINLDGELLMAKDAVFTLKPAALRFFYPAGLTYAASHTAAGGSTEHTACAGVSEGCSPAKG
jgi:YegS/Rv2252/BmrU family lipid kinase